MTSAAATRDKPNNAIGREKEGLKEGGNEKKREAGIPRLWLVVVM